MDINKIQQQLIQALEQKNADQITTQITRLSRILNLIVGKPSEVEVLSSEPMSSADQQKLQQQTAAALSQVREQIRNLAAKIDPTAAEKDDRSLSQDTRIPPALRAVFVRLLDQQALLTANKLHWADISQNGKTTTIYTDQTLAVGQKISIQLTNPQRLSFTSLSDAKTHNQIDDQLHAPQVTLASQKPSTASAITNALILDELLKKPDLPPEKLNNNQAAAATQTLTAQTTAPQNAAKNALLLAGYKDLLPSNHSANLDGAQLKNVMQNKIAPEAAFELTNKLRELLSLNTRPSQIFSLINRIAQEPKILFDQPETKSLEQILKTIATRIRGPEFFYRPEGIKNSIKQSGIFYESRLNQLVKNNPLPSTHLLSTNSTQESNQLNSSINAKLQNIIGSDNKGSMLSLIKSSLSEERFDPMSFIKDALTQDRLTKAPLTQDNLTNSKSTAVEQLNKLIEQLQAKDLPSSTSNKIQHEIVKLIQQEAAHSLTKIQIQQFQSLLQHSDSELGSKHQVQSWQLEVPIRHQDMVHSVHIDIERHWLNPEDAPEKTTGSTKTKQWNITLRFDLPLMGEFCAQLIMQGENLTAKLWADRTDTLKRIQDELNNLKKQMESDGIVVQSLQCSGGLPAKKQIRLSYSLIDVST